MKPLLFVVGVLLTAAPASADFSLEVDVSEKQLRAVEDGHVVEEFDIAVGKDPKPTPTGAFTIKKIIWNPAWHPPDEKWARGKTPKPPGHPDNPMKRVKMFFREPDYYIHGTDDLDSLGSEASHGCVRMAPDDVTRLAQAVMDHGGQPRPLPWYRRIFRSRASKTVLLTAPVPIRIVP